MFPLGGESQLAAERPRSKLIADPGKMESQAMSTSEQAVYRTADEMIRISGREAAKEALTYANELGEKRDVEGRRLWLRVCDAIEDLLGPTPTKH